MSNAGWPITPTRVQMQTTSPSADSSRPSGFPPTSPHGKQDHFTTLVAGSRGINQALTHLKDQWQSTKTVAQQFGKPRRDELTPEQEARYGAAFRDAARGWGDRAVLDLPGLQAAFLTLGFGDVLPEDIESMALKTLKESRTQARNARHPDPVRQEEFCDMMGVFEEKYTFFASIKPSPEEKINVGLRALAHYFRKVYFMNGDAVTLDDPREVQLVMAGAFRVCADAGKTHLHICELGKGALLGKGCVPHNASKVECCTPQGVVLACKAVDIERRMGKEFLAALQAGVPSKDEWFRKRVRHFAHVAKRNQTAGLHIPFMMPRPKTRQEVPTIQGGQEGPAPAPEFLTGPSAWGSGAASRPQREGTSKDLRLQASTVRQRSASSMGALGGG
ncbi:hypothetical protein T484DRAFT_1913714, partial [Baffinella frigidus]